MARAARRRPAADAEQRGAPLDADPDTLATGLTAALQGGYLLAETAHDVRPTEIALEMALDQARSFLTA
jgi:hypothetical protein